jgi:CheY-like chemotaxis protein
MTRLVIAEDSAILRDGLVQLLVERGHEVVAKVGSADELIEAVHEFTPDVAVVDIRMPPTFTDEGLVAAVALRRSHPDVGVLVFSRNGSRRVTPQNYWREIQRVWAICSRIGSPTSPSSTPPYAASHRAAPRSTRRWCVS